MKIDRLWIILALGFWQTIPAWGNPFEITGTVMMETGQPLTNIAVQAFPAGSWSWQSTLSDLTDVSGNYRLSVTNGMWQVQPVLPQLTNRVFRYLPARQVEVNSNNPVVDFVAETIPLNTSVSGLVVDEQNRPMTNLVVSAQGATWLASRTDSQGRFGFLLGAGNWNLTLNGTAPELQERLIPTRSLSVAEGVSQNNLLLRVIQPNRQITGAVKIADATWIYAEMLTNGQSYRISQSTTTNGQFHLEVVDGIWTISASAAQSQFLDHTVRVAGTNQEITLEGRLLTNSTPTTLLSGRVVDNWGAPLKGRTVFASSNRYISDETSTNGAFEFMVEPGLWKVGLSSGEAEIFGALTPSSLSLQVHTNSPALTNLLIVAQRTNREILGTLQDSTGHPIPNVAINAYVERSGISYNSSDYTGAHGEFRLNVFEANWRLSVQSSDLLQRGYLSVPELGVLVATTNPVLSITAQPLPPPVYVRGQVMDEGGSSISGYSLSLAAWDGSYALQVTTDGDGRFGLPAFPGTWRLSGSMRTGWSYRSLPAQTITLGEKDLTVDFLLKSIKPSAQLKGIVISHSGTPISNLLVSVSSIDASVQVITTEEGSFEAGVFGGEWNISLDSTEVSRRGLITPEGQTVTVKDGVDPHHLVIVARSPNRSLAGTLTDTAGRPMLGRSVQAYATVQGTNYWVATYPDSWGRFLLPVFDGLWHLSIASYQGDDYLRTSEQHIQVAGADQEMSFLFQPRITTTRLRGQVVDEANTPLKGIWIYAWHSQSSLSTLTDGSGHFDFELYAGLWSLHVDSYQTQKQGWLAPNFSSAINVGTGVDQTDHVLILRKASRQISGILHDNQGQSIANVHISSRANINGSYYGTSTTTDREGRYIMLACEGLWWISASLGLNDGYLPTIEQSISVAGANPVMNLTAYQQAPSAHLEGQIVDSQGAPLPNLVVLGWHSLGHLDRETDAQGHFKFDVIPGRWNLSVNDSQAADRGSMAFDLTPGPNVVRGTNNIPLLLVMPRADRKIAGLIQDNEGNPTAGVSISARNYANGMNYRASTTTDSIGHFSLGVSDGIWQIATSLGQNDGFMRLPEQTVIVNGSDQTASLMAQRFVPTARLGGRVVDSTGYPVTNLSVNASHPDVSFTTITDNQGYFEIGAIAGDWNLSIAASEMDSNRAMDSSLTLTNQVKDGAALTNLILVAYRPSVRISGLIKDAGGHPVADIPMAASARSGSTNLWTKGATGSDGHFFLDVIPGTWRIAFDGAFLNAHGWQCLPVQEVTVSAFSDLHLDLVALPIQGNGLTPVLHGPVLAKGGTQPWRLESQVDNLYRILASTDFTEWTPILTNSTRHGTIEFVDPDAKNSSKRFYRGQLLP